MLLIEYARSGKRNRIYRISTRIRNGFCSPRVEDEAGGTEFDEDMESRDELFKEAAYIVVSAHKVRHRFCSAN